ncbi:MAG: CvpA family protein [Pseudomonadota bacterium]
MEVADWIIVAVIGISALISIMRGFVREALSLVTLIAAVVIARMFGNQVATLLVDYISVPSMRLLASYAGLFIVTMIVGGMINHLVAQLVEMTGLSGTDRLLGMLFGAARGALIVVVAVAVLSRMPVTEDNWWRDSRLIPSFQAAAESIQAMIFGAAEADAQPTRG